MVPAVTFRTLRHLHAHLHHPLRGVARVRMRR
jgi:hypothetical protein